MAWVHRLSNIDRDAKTADCSNCGPGIKIKAVSGGGSACRLRIKATKPKTPPHTAGYLRRAYGLTIEEHRALVEAQGGKCAICLSLPDEGTVLHIDHCHANGTVRGLLCARCNKGLGHFRDSPALLVAASRYLS